MSRWAGHPTAIARRHFYADVAPGLVAAAAGPLPAWTDKPRQAEQLGFFADDDTMCVIAAGDEGNGSAADPDLALAFGLALAQDRDLVLLLPDGSEPPTLQRAAWVVVPVRIFTYGSTERDREQRDVTEQVVPSRPDVLGTVRSWGWRAGEDAELGDRRAWVAHLVDWCEAHPDLAARHRRSYLSWHCAGRQVLKIRRTRVGLEVLAGVRYSKPTDGQLPPPPPLQLSGALSGERFAAVKEAVATAVEQRLTGTDSGHEEHRLQHAINELKRRRGVPFLGLRRLEREAPAWRPGRSSAYVDFIGVDKRDSIHIVETKIGNDPMLAIQALDYWIWAQANRSQLASHLGIERESPAVFVNLVVAASPRSTGVQGKAVGPYTLRQLEAIDGSMPWQIHLARDWRNELTVESLLPRTCPPSPAIWKPVTEPRFAQRLHAQLMASAPGPLRGPFFRQPLDGIVPEARVAWRALSERRLLHRFAHHVRSSQAFALNSFAGLDEATLLEIARIAGIGGATAASAPVFEFEDLDDLLAEATEASPHRTQVDVRIDLRRPTGARVGLLIEVKLSELDFGNCSAFQSERNPRRHVCLQPGGFGSDPASCFQLSNHDRGLRRRYDAYLTETTDQGWAGSGCSFRLGCNQPMRNVALASSLLERGELDEAYFGLYAPAANRTIWRRWTEAKIALQDASPATLTDLPAEAVLALLPRQRADAMQRRYGLTALPRG